MMPMVVEGITYWNQGYGYQQGYGPGYGGSDDSPHGYYGYGPGYYYRHSWQETRDSSPQRSPGTVSTMVTFNNFLKN
ncbi:hypothetical protein MUG91_G77n190 [Manis pentadactyla]|nr:hypothetical protein MUG91_G77n190 [Manis pentadactyla]